MTPIIASLLKIIDEFLALKIIKEQNKYVDKRLELEKGITDEFNKPVWDGQDISTPAQTFRNDALLADLTSQLCQLADAIASAARQSSPSVG